MNLYQRALFGFCWRLLGDTSAAQDASQDVLIKAYQHLPQFRQESLVRTWLYRIAYRHCLQVVHQENNHQYILDCNDKDIKVSIHGEEPQPPEEGLFSEPPPEVVVRKVLKKLKPEHRALLTLKLLKELPYPEISEILGKSVRQLQRDWPRACDAFITAYEAMTKVHSRI